MAARSLGYLVEFQRRSEQANMKAASCVNAQYYSRLGTPDCSLRLGFSLGFRI